MASSISQVVQFIAIAVFLHLVYLVVNVLYFPLQPGEYAQEDVGLEIGEILEKYSYPLQNHTVETEDGYILEIHRIPHGKNSVDTKDRPVVLLMHGLLATSDQWLIAGIDKALPYYLVENGYDVWLANARGNYYSRKHKLLNPDDNYGKFYNFSWNEIGYYDCPAVIDYIISKTGQKKIFYIGHSQGTASFYVMTSERPEYNNKIRLMVGLAPVVYAKGVKTPAFRIPALFQSLFEWAVEYFKFYELLPRSNYNIQIANKFCHADSLLQPACLFIYGIIGGFNAEKINTTRLPLFFSISPAGASIKQLLHYTQLENSGKFRKYDLGSEKNLIQYGKETPPEYPLEKVTAPVALFYGNNDWLTTKENIKKLSSRLPNVVTTKEVSDEYFTHFDFLYSEHAVDILYPDILKLFRKF